MKTVGNLLITSIVVFFTFVPTRIQSSEIKENINTANNQILEQTIVSRIDSIEKCKERIREIQKELE